MNTQENDALLAAEYVLGVVDDATRAQLAQRLASDADFARQVVGWQKAFSGVDVTTQDVTPAPEVWRAIERDLNVHVLPLRRKPGPASWLGWAIAAALAGVLVFNYVNKPEQPLIMQPVAVLSGAQPGQQFVVSMSKSASMIEVSALNVTLPEAKSLQLWLIKGTDAPRSLGLITRQNRNAFRLSADALESPSVLAISLEPVGGSKQAGPSGPVIFQGKISQL